MSSIIDEMVFGSSSLKERISSGRPDDLMYHIRKIAKFNDESI